MEKTEQCCQDHSFFEEIKDSGITEEAWIKSADEEIRELKNIKYQQNILIVTVKDPSALNNDIYLNSELKLESKRTIKTTSKLWDFYEFILYLVQNAQKNCQNYISLNKITECIISYMGESFKTEIKNIKTRLDKIYKLQASDTDTFSKLRAELPDRCILLLDNNEPDTDKCRKILDAIEELNYLIEKFGDRNISALKKELDTNADSFIRDYYSSNDGNKQPNAFFKVLDSFVDKKLEIKRKKDAKISDGDIRGLRCTESTALYELYKYTHKVKSFSWEEPKDLKFGIVHMSSLLHACEGCCALLSCVEFERLTFTGFKRSNDSQRSFSGDFVNEGVLPDFELTRILKRRKQ